MVKLICLDLDGTLLNSNLEISKANREAIEQARSKGIKVALATGRMYASALAYAKELDIDVPIITMNGALIKHPVTEVKITDLVIPQYYLEEVICILAADDIRPNFYNEFTLFVGESPQRYQRMLANAAFDSRYEFKINDEAYTYQDVIREAGATIHKGILFPEPAMMEEVRKRLKQIGDLSIVSSSPFNIEITHGQANKGNAIKALGKDLGISVNDMMAIGDSENDRSMLDVAGHPIIMGNANSTVKAGKGIITLDNNNDGVALAIRKYALGDIC